jgi:hypothetical protein
MKIFKKLVLFDPKIPRLFFVLFHKVGDNLYNSLACGSALNFSNAVHCLLGEFRLRRGADGPDNMRLF